MDACALVCELHGRLLRAISDDMGLHLQGLQQAAALLRKRGGIPARSLRRLAHVDIAFAVQRHVTSASAESWFQDIMLDVRLGRREARGAADGASADKQQCLEAVHASEIVAAAVEMRFRELEDAMEAAAQCARAAFEAAGGRPVLFDIGSCSDEEAGELPEDSHEFVGVREMRDSLAAEIAQYEQELAADQREMMTLEW